MTNFYELLNRIHKKPAMYIGSPSIGNLFMFLCGYQHACDLLETPVTEQEEEFAEFQLWLQKDLLLTPPLLRLKLFCFIQAMKVRLLILSLIYWKNLLRINIR
ncbi:MAG: hypothetical protein HC894_09580 [Microcoleus sp. SM1_3_4]|nr:hypothetical protein [Microcoleus sp. SM1_3_4]